MKTPHRFPTATRHRGAFRGCPAMLCSVALSVSILLLCHPSAPPLAEPGVSTLHIPIFLTPLFPTPPVFSRNARFATNLLSRRSLSSIHFAPKHPKKLGFSPSPFFYKNASAAGAPSTPHLGPPPSPESSCLIFLRTPGRLRPQSSSDPPSRRDPMRLPAVAVFSWHGRRHSRPAFTPIILASQNARPSDCRASAGIHLRHGLQSVVTNGPQLPPEPASAGLLEQRIHPDRPPFTQPHPAFRARLYFRGMAGGIYASPPQQAPGPRKRTDFSTAGLQPASTLDTGFSPWSSTVLSFLPSRLQPGFSNKGFIQTVPLTQPYPLPPPPCPAALHLLYSHRTIPRKRALK